MVEDISFIFKSDMQAKDLPSLCEEITKVEGVAKAYPTFPDAGDDPDLIRLGFIDVKGNYKITDVLERVKASYGNKLESIYVPPDRRPIK